MPNLSVSHQSTDRFELQMRGHRVVCDQPVADGGTDQGPTPTELFELDEGTTADVLARLRRIQGQVGGIIRMVEAGRGCRDVVLQISAAGRALDQTGFKILASGLRECLQDEQAAEQAGYSQDELEKLFLQLR